MKSSLTNKDKKLLLFLFLFVVIVGIGYWGIYPQIKAFVKLETEIDKEEVKKSVNEQKVSNLIFVETQCDEFEDSMAENKEKFFDRMNEADVDLLLTGKAIKHKLESFSLNIQIDDRPSERKAYRYSKLYNDQLNWESERAAAEAAMDNSKEEDELLGLSNKSKKGEEKAEEEIPDEQVDIFGNTEVVGANNDIYAARVTMTVGGNRSDLEDFLAEIMDSDKEILITSFAWSKYRVQRTKDGTLVKEGSLENGEYEIAELDALTITMELYMCDKD